MDVTFYDTRTAGGKVRAFHDSIFTRDPARSELCNIAIRKFGTNLAGCNQAAAFTSWNVAIHQDVYDAEGHRRSPQALIEFKADMQLPHWEPQETPEPRDLAEARRFAVTTAYHERGHVHTGELAADAVARFISHLPISVPPTSVRAMNDAARTVIFDFYVAQGHFADKEYDRISRHGESQGAILGRKVPKEDDAEPSHVPRVRGRLGKM